MATGWPNRRAMRASAASPTTIPICPPTLVIA
jgi:hypothetical protein